MSDICNKNHILNESQHEGASQVSEGAWVWGSSKGSLKKNLLIF